jgi:hypothetical protein
MQISKRFVSYRHFDRGNSGWSDRGSRSESGLVANLSKKNGLKLSSMRCTIFPIGDSLGGKTKVREYRVSIRNVLNIYVPECP